MKRWFPLPWRRALSTLWNVGGFPGGAARVVLVVASMTAPFGCDSGSFIPPPPEELQESAGARESATGAVSGSASWETEPAAARSVELILDRRDPEEEGIVATAARTQGGIDMVKLKLALLGERDRPARQVDMVRESLARRPLALIVEPADPTDRRLAQVIDEARGEGVPVVLLGRPLAGDQGTAPNLVDTKPANGNGATQSGAGQGATSPPNPGSRKPMVLVKPPSFTSSAQQLVASAIRNAQNARLEPKGGAILMINTIGDPFIPDRALAIRSALKANGITKIEEVSFSKHAEDGSKRLTERLEADPKLVMVFSVDSLSSLATREVMTAIEADRPFILAGYAAEESYAQSTRMADFAALALYAPTRLVRRAIATAVNLAQGRNVPSVIELPIEVYDSPDDSTTAKSPSYNKSKSPPSKIGPRPPRG